MRTLLRQSIVLTILSCSVAASSACGDSFTLNGHTFTVPEEFEVLPVASPPLVDRPISAAFDENGFLYVTDSSGSNDPVEVQVKERPHRIVRLEDSDGIFDMCGFSNTWCIGSVVPHCPKRQVVASCDSAMT